MIDVRELRIGNIISHGKYNSLWRINFFLGSSMANVDSAHVNFATDDESEVELSECSPAELTEKLLIKLGLINSSHAGLKRYSHPDCDFELGEYKGEWYLVDREMQLTVKVKYVHKAQNLCYELHNLELTIKETAQ